jgi:hypothetical protein
VSWGGDERRVLECRPTWCLQDRDNALELAFQTRYGAIVSYKWFGDG